MSGKKKILGILAVIVAIGVVVLVLSMINNTATPGSPATNPVSTSSTSAPVPQNVAVPDKGATSTPLGIAVPVVQGAEIRQAM